MSEKESNSNINNITIRKVKDTWDKQELINKIIDFSTHYSGMERSKVEKQVNKWVEKNL